MLDEPENHARVRKVVVNDHNNIDDVMIQP